MERVAGGLKSRRAGESGETSLVLLAGKYLAYFLIALVMGRAKAGAFSPFLAGWTIGLVWAGESAVALLPVHIVAALISQWPVKPLLLLGEAITALGLAAFTLGTRRTRLGGSTAAFVLAAVLSRIPYAVLAVKGGESGVIMAAGVILELGFAYTVRTWARAVTMGRLERKLHDLELACLAVTLFAFSAGLNSLEVFGVRVVVAVAGLLFPLTAFFAGKTSAVVVAAVMGAGAAAAGGEASDIAMLTFVALVYAIFSDAPRALSLTGALLADVLFALWLTGSAERLPFDLIALFVGGLIFALLPKKRLRAAKSRWFSPPSHLALRALIADTGKNLAGRLGYVGAALGEMERAIRRDYSPRGISIGDVEKRLYSAACAGCGACDGRRECADAALLALAERSAAGERCSVTDVPYFIENDCPRAARLFSVAGECADECARRAHENKAGSGERAELAFQLSGVRVLLNEAAKKAGAEPVFDDDKRDFLTEELTLRGVSVADALTVGGETTLVVRSDPAAASEAASSALGGRTTATVYPWAEGGYSVVRLGEATKYDALFASASASKSRAATGDTHSFTRLGGGKFMLALCDGMGFGTEANRISETAMGLVESYYRAGFSDEFTLRSVNAFLSRENEESFAAFDIMICDLNTLERTLIKLGSPASYIKSERGAVRVEGSALPLGAVGELSPSVTTDTARDGDAVFFTSDGVSDAFEGDELACFIASLDTSDLRAACGAVLERAKFLTGGEVRDDMTVVAARVFLRV